MNEGDQKMVQEYNQAIESVIGYYGIDRDFAIRYYWDEVEAYLQIFDKFEVE
jgi:hypothetical protein